jgi:hypothetical protein
MPAPVLEEFQFDLDGYVFGKGMPVFVDAEGFDPGDPEKITQDGVNPITGARTFGRDMHTSTTWTWACYLSTEDVEGALAAAAAMGAKWRDEKWLEPTEIAMLRYRIGGRTRCVFGKPRRFSFKPGNAILQGNLPPLATFDTSDTKTYDEDEQFVDLGMQRSLPGGFAVPFEAPLAIELPPDVTPQGSIEVSGDAKAPLIVEFHGPWTNGSIEVGDDFKAGFTGSLLAGQSITIDGSPWATSVTRTGGASVALSRETRINRALVGPGQYAAIMRGSDETGTARGRVRWRNAHSTL